jgi:hypothetical protein
MGRGTAPAWEDARLASASVFPHSSLTCTCTLLLFPFAPHPHPTPFRSFEVLPRADRPIPAPAPGEAEDGDADAEEEEALRPPEESIEATLRGAMFGQGFVADEDDVSDDEGEGRGSRASASGESGEGRGSGASANAGASNAGGSGGSSNAGGAARSVDADDGGWGSDLLLGKGQKAGGGKARKR